MIFILTELYFIQMQFTPHSYSELCSHVSNLIRDGHTREGGEFFELYVAKCLRHHGYDVKQNNEISEELKTKYQIPPRGEGIDGILCHPDEKEWHPYQVKFTSLDQLEDVRLLKFYKHAPLLIEHGMVKPAYLITNCSVTDPTFTGVNETYRCIDGGALEKLMTPAVFGVVSSAPEETKILPEVDPWEEAKMLSGDDGQADIVAKHFENKVACINVENSKFYVFNTSDNSWEPQTISYIINMIPSILTPIIDKMIDKERKTNNNLRKLNQYSTIRSRVSSSSGASSIMKFAKVRLGKLEQMSKPFVKAGISEEIKKKSKPSHLMYYHIIIKGPSGIKVRWQSLVCVMTKNLHRWKDSQSQHKYHIEHDKTGNYILRCVIAIAEYVNSGNILNTYITAYNDVPQKFEISVNPIISSDDLRDILIKHFSIAPFHNENGPLLWGDAFDWIHREICHGGVPRQHMIYRCG